MLGRATKAYVPKKDLAKELFPSSSPAQDGNVADGLKKVRQDSQSIGGFLGGHTNTARQNPPAPLRSRSPNIRNALSRVSSTASSSRPYPTPPTSRAPSIFSRADSFSDTQGTIDLTSDSQPDYKLAKLSQHVDIFSNDFESDVDLSGDEYELPKAPVKTPMAAPPKPTQQKSPTSLKRRLSASQAPSSTPIPWSSSPASHMAPPPVQQPVAIPEDVPIPPAKRRTLPWAQKRAEEDERAELEADREELLAAGATSSSPQATCFRCKQKGHFVNDCPNRGKGQGSVHEYTPLPKDKDKKMPWNNTGSAIGAEKKLYRDKQKAKVDREKERRLGAMERKKKVAMVPVTLSKEQEDVKKLVCNDSKSVFFTGSAGTGKSVLMRDIITALKKKYAKEPERVAVTASTGLAACNIGGVTLHSFGGIGLGKESVSELVKKIKRNQKAKNRWIKTKILIIDEVSMVDGELFDKLEGIARAMRNNGRPFGGIQLVITGDFFQLPPVPDFANKGREVKFAFEADTWNTCINHVIGLTEVFRQKDPVFANMLNEMRLGKISEQTIKAFKALDRNINFEAGMSATELFPTRNEVDNSNSTRMRNLHGKSFRYDAVDTGALTDLTMRDKLLSNMMAPKCIELKKGAQVMLIKNMDDGLVNGSLGTVTAFMTTTGFEYYKASGGDSEAMGDDDSAINRPPLRKADGTPDTGQLLPLVNFKSADNTTRELLVEPEEWKIELPNGEVQAQRSQLPLILAWALSIHKAQGQTLPLVKIDLKKIFEKGQAYVALSRATSQDGLIVLNFDKSKVMAHPRVAQFYNSLYSVNEAMRHPKVAGAQASKIPAVPVAKASADAIYLDDEDEQEAMRYAYG